MAEGHIQRVGAGALVLAAALLIAPHTYAAVLTSSDSCSSQITFSPRGLDTPGSPLDKLSNACSLSLTKFDHNLGDISGPIHLTLDVSASFDLSGFNPTSDSQTFNTFSEAHNYTVDFTGLTYFPMFAPEGGGNVVYNTGHLTLLDANSNGPILSSMGDIASHFEYNLLLQPKMMGSGFFLLNLSYWTAFIITGTDERLYYSVLSDIEFAGTITYTYTEPLPPAPTPTPEPSVWAMLIAGFGATGAVLRRRSAISA